MQNARLKIKDRSLLSKGEYLYYHALFGVIFAFDIYKIMPIFVPIAYYNNSVTRLILCMVITSLVGASFSYKYNRTDLALVADTLAGMGLYTILTIGRYSSIFIIILGLATLVITIIGILLIVCKKVKKKNHMKQVIISRFFCSVQLIRINVCVASAIVIIALPIGLNVLQNEKMQSDYARISAVDAYLGAINSRYENLEVNEIYGDEYRLSENLDTIKLIRDNDTFQSLSYDEKCEVIKAVIYCEARYQGLCEINVEFKELNDRTFGQYSHSTRTIYINSKQIKNGSLPGGSNKEILNTCLHETRHVYQHLLVELYAQATPEQRNLLAFTEYGVGSWGSNIDNYHSDTSNIEECMKYYNQPIEEDARKYASCETIEYFNLIDELLAELEN